MKNKPEFCLRKTYLNMISGSVGSPMFRNSFFKVGDKIKDLCQNGRFSCAFYVSCILKIFGLTKEVHLTVDGLEKDMLDSGWFESLSRKGVVIIWKPRKGADNKMHKHIGFYLSSGRCVSNNPSGNTPFCHDLYLGKQCREIEKIYWHSLLDK